MEIEIRIEAIVEAEDQQRGWNHIHFISQHLRWIGYKDGITGGEELPNNQVRLWKKMRRNYDD